MSSLPDDDLWGLLRRLDDPKNVERPANFDPELASERFVALRDLLASSFDGEVAVVGWSQVQDASHFGRLVIAADLTGSAEQLVVTVSNFWPLVSVALGNPGTYDRAELEARLAPEDRRRLEQTLASLGHVVVPESLLAGGYDGRVEFLRCGSWWMRFFDYL